MIYKLINCFISPIVLRFIRLRGIAGSVKVGRRHSPRPGGRTRWRPGRLLEERSREQKNTNNNNNNGSESVRPSGCRGGCQRVKPLKYKFKLKNIIQAKVEFDSHCDSFLPQIIDVDQADPLTGLVSWMKIETKQKTFEEKVPSVLGLAALNCNPTPPPMKRV